MDGEVCWEKEGLLEEFWASGSHLVCEGLEKVKADAIYFESSHVQKGSLCRRLGACLGSWTGTDGVWEEKHDYREGRESGFAKKVV